MTKGAAEAEESATDAVSETFDGTVTRKTPALGSVLSLLTVGVYLLIVVAVVVVAISRSSHGSGTTVVANQDLRAGRLLTPEDLRPVGLAGYVVHDLKAGATVSAKDLVPVAPFAASTSELVLLVPAKPGLAPGKLNKGTKVQLCQAGKSALTVIAQAVICSSPESCFVAAPVPPAKAATLRPDVVAQLECDA